MIFILLLLMFAVPQFYTTDPCDSVTAFPKVADRLPSNRYQPSPRASVPCLQDTYIEEGWYGELGRVILTEPPDYLDCGTRYPAYIHSMSPADSDGFAEATIYVTIPTGPHELFTIKTKLCDANKRIYYLKRINSGCSAYCVQCVAKRCNDTISTPIPSTGTTTLTNQNLSNTEPATQHNHADSRKTSSMKTWNAMTGLKTNIFKRPPKAEKPKSMWIIGAVLGALSLLIGSGIGIIYKIKTINAKSAKVSVFSDDLKISDFSSSPLPPTTTLPPRYTSSPPPRYTSPPPPRYTSPPPPYTTEAFAN